MQNSVDASLLGGAVMRAGDLVIDGSLKGRLERLAEPEVRRSRRARKRIDMSIKASEISDLIKARIEKFQSAAEARNVGTVVSVTDGIVRIHGLADARYGEMLEFAGNTFGLALNLEQDSVGAVVLGDYKHISRRLRRSRPPAASSKCRWAPSCSAAWSMRWASPSTARARSTPS